MAISTMPAEGAATQVAVIGPMTIYEAADSKRELLQALAAGSGLELDLSNVDEIDTAGLQLLLLTCREGARTGKPVRLVAKSAAVLEVLHCYRLAAHFSNPVEPSAVSRSFAALPPEETADA
jgi:anti-sigma B factor antagonist